jgi:hypothetical protein
MVNMYGRASADLLMISICYKFLRHINNLRLALYIREMVRGFLNNVVHLQIHIVVSMTYKWHNIYGRGFTDFRTISNTYKFILCFQ